jgi:hypothetical protein
MRWIEGARGERAPLVSGAPGEGRGPLVLSRGFGKLPNSIMMKRFVGMVRQLRQERRELGWKGLLRRRGWGLVLAVVAFYLVRDLVLYVLIPLALAIGLSR